MRKKESNVFCCCCCWDHAAAVHLQRFSLSLSLFSFIFNGSRVWLFSSTHTHTTPAYFDLEVVRVSGLIVLSRKGQPSACAGVPFGPFANVGTFENLDEIHFFVVSPLPTCSRFYHVVALLELLKWVTIAKIRGGPGWLRRKLCR